MKTSEILAGMRELLDSPEKWCQFANSRNAQGEAVVPDDPEAQSWCLQGAALRVTDMERNATRATSLCSLVNVLRAIARAEAWAHGAISWNDSTHRTYEDVVLALKKAQIAEEEREVRASWSNWGH